jgi:hypothetical protein
LKCTSLFLPFETCSWRSRSILVKDQKLRFLLALRYLSANGQPCCVRAEVSKGERRFSTLKSITAHTPSERCHRESSGIRPTSATGGGETGFLSVCRFPSRPGGGADWTKVQLHPERGHVLVIERSRWDAVSGKAPRTDRLTRKVGTHGAQP